VPQGGILSLHPALEDMWCLIRYRVSLCHPRPDYIWLGRVSGIGNPLECPREGLATLFLCCMKTSLSVGWFMSPFSHIIKDPIQGGLPMKKKLLLVTSMGH
jgi:hypothetical protein